MTGNKVSNIQLLSAGSLQTSNTQNGTVTAGNQNSFRAAFNNRARGLAGFLSRLGKSHPNLKYFVTAGAETARNRVKGSHLISDLIGGRRPVDLAFCLESLEA